MEKLAYPLIVTDFDGTLLRTDYKIADCTLAQIERYKADGGHFALCTGRTLSSALLIAKELGLTGLLACFQGSVVADIQSGELVVDGGLMPLDAARICRLLEEMGLHFHVYDTYEYYSNANDEWLRHYESVVKVKARVIDNEPLSAFVERTKMPVRKVLVLVDPEKREGVYKAIAQRFGQEFYVTYSAAFLVEITNASYSKATALERIAKHYGVPVEKTISVGDSLNDLPMIECAGLGIAVKNADNALKAAANMVCEYTNDEDALGEIIRRYAYKN